MLYDPKWEKPATDVLSLTSLIAWLETKNPSERYTFFDCNGACLFSQYLLARPGFDRHFGDDPDFSQMAVWEDLHQKFFVIACDAPHTFGAALARARSMT